MKRLAMASLAVAVSACGGGSSGPGGASATSQTDADGIYSGALQTAGGSDTLQGLIDVNGQGFLVDDNAPGTVYRISSLATSGNSLQGTFVAYIAGGATLPNGKSSDTGSFAATFVRATSITGSATPDGASSGSSFSLQYQQAAYEQAASFAIIAGAYSGNLQDGAGGADGVTITVDSTGVWSGTSSACTLSGQASIPQATRNAYELSGTATCSGVAATISGVALHTDSSSLLGALGLSTVGLTLEFGNGSNLLWAGALTRQ